MVGAAPAEAHSARAPVTGAVSARGGLDCTDTADQKPVRRGMRLLPEIAANSGEASMTPATTSARTSPPMSSSPTRRLRRQRELQVKLPVEPSTSRMDSFKAGVDLPERCHLLVRLSCATNESYRRAPRSAPKQRQQLKVPPRVRPKPVRRSWRSRSTRRDGSRRDSAPENWCAAADDRQPCKRQFGALHGPGSPPGEGRRTPNCTEPRQLRLLNQRAGRRAARPDRTRRRTSRLTPPMPCWD